MENEELTKYNHGNAIISKSTKNSEQTESTKDIHKSFPNQDEREKKFKCDLCDRKFGQKHHLASHFKTEHDSTKTFRCDICNMNFVLKTIYNNHIDIVHKNVKRINCKTCSKTFSSKVTLVIHENDVRYTLNPFEVLNCYI